MKLRASIPLSAYLTAERTEDLSPTTTFKFKGLQVRVQFVGDEALDLPGAPVLYFRRLRGMQVELTDDDGGLQALLAAHKAEALLKVLGSVVNRILAAIRNFGTVAHVQPLKMAPERADAWFRALQVEASEDGETWNAIRPMRTLQDLMGDKFLLFQEHVGELNFKDWRTVEEAIQDDLKAGPEREFFVNALEHLRIGNLRLAVVESVICLEIVLTEWLLLVLPIRGVPKVKELLGPELDLNARVKLLLPLLLESGDLASVSLDDVTRNVNYRNKVAHVIGNLPDNVPPELIRRGASATLQLARLLAFQRDKLKREPELDKLAEAMGDVFGLPKPKIYAIGGHVYSVAFDIPFDDEFPTDERLEVIAAGVHGKLTEYDPRYRPGEHASVPSVVFTRLDQPVSVWLDGKLRKIQRPKPSGLLEIMRNIAASPKGPQEG
jgi:hypothetical protein